MAQDQKCVDDAKSRNQRRLAEGKMLCDTGGQPKSTLTGVEHTEPAKEDNTAQRSNDCTDFSSRSRNELRQQQRPAQPQQPPSTPFNTQWWMWGCWKSHVFEFASVMPRKQWRAVSRTEAIGVPSTRTVSAMNNVIKFVCEALLTRAVLLARTCRELCHVTCDRKSCHTQEQLLHH